MKQNLIVVLFFQMLSLVSVGQSIQLDKKIGAENAQQIRVEMNLSVDTLQEAYIQSIGDKLTAQLDKSLFDYEYKILVQEEPNAFALPGGHIYISTGLLYLIQEEDELACILGHEIIHSNNRHSIQQAKKSILPKLVEVPGNIVGIFAHNVGAMINAPLETSNALLFASYGRKFENEADREGIRLAQKAGYDPHAMTRILTRMTNAIETIANYKEKKSYFSHHPYTPDRLKTIEKVIRKMENTGFDTSDDVYLAQIDSLSFGLPVEAGTVIDNRFLHQEMNFSFDFPEDWIIENTPLVVRAVHPQNKGVMMVQLDSDSISARKAALKFMDTMPVQLKQMISRAEPTTIGEKECFVIESQQVTQYGKLCASIHFIPLNNRVYRITSSTPIEHQFQIEESLLTLDAIQPNEYEEITNNRLRIVKANKGESISELSQRTGNVLDLEKTAIINSLDLQSTFSGSDYVKVVLEYPFVEEVE